MKAFLSKLIILFILFISSLFGLDMIISEGLKNSNYREITKWNEVVKGGIDAELLILGSSRALVHFDCYQIEKATGLKCYNLGFDGTNYELQNLMLDLYLRNNNLPRKVIWSLDLHTFQEIRDFYGFEQLIPYYGEQEVKKMLYIQKSIPEYYFYLPIVRFKFNPKMSWIGILKYFGLYNRPETLIKGYREMDRKWDFSFEESLAHSSERINYILSDRLLNSFKNRIEGLKNTNTEVILVFSPLHYDALEIVGNQPEIINYYKKLSNDLGVKFYSYDQNKINLSREWFYNANHLNKEGVKKWLQIFLIDFQ